MDRTLLVTGGNRGIGLAIVKKLAENSNDTILLGCRNTSDGEKIASTMGDNVRAVELDLSSKESSQKNIASLLENFPRIDGLVNNAGILIEGDFLNTKVSDLELAFQVNTLAPYLLIKAVLPQMIKNNYGRIVNISSGWGSFDDGLTGPFSYSFTKANLNALTLTVSQNLPENIKINSMCPGWCRTSMGGESATRSPEQGAETAVWLINQNEDSPTGQFFRDQKPIAW